MTYPKRDRAEMDRRPGQTHQHPQQYLPLTPPQTPESSIAFTSYAANTRDLNPNDKPDVQPPPSYDGEYSIPELDLDAVSDLPSVPRGDIAWGAEQQSKVGTGWYPTLLETIDEETEDKYTWHKGMSEEERDRREAWLAEKRGRKGLRIVIVTENFLPKVDGVTRTLSRLLEHLQSTGHECILLGPSSTLSSYASHPLVGTLGIPLVVYPGLKLNFLRPKFLSVIRDWEPDVVHFVDPIWLGAQTILAMELGWAGDGWMGQDGPVLGKGLGGAVVASYHTNLATYATLFGASFLTPLIWAFQSTLYSKLLLTLCPSPSTRSMLCSQGFEGVRLWPRGVDLGQFSPAKRCHQLRRSWGIGGVTVLSGQVEGEKRRSDSMSGSGRAVVEGLGGLMTPPLTPWNGPVDGQGPITTTQPSLAPHSHNETEDRVVILYVGRISWEKNLHLLLSAYAHLAKSAKSPKLVFVGDGPARSDLETRCKKERWDAVFMGHRSGEELARCYASADLFVFPSFTETFGQVVLEALASGLPVIGLDAEGTRDLVSHGSTGLLLPLVTSSPPTPTSSDNNSGLSWAEACKPDSVHFAALAQGYAELIARAAEDKDVRSRMGEKACTDGIKGYTWWDAMEACVDGYRESMRMARTRRSVQVIPHTTSEQDSTPIPPAKTRRGLSLVNRLVSRRLAYKPGSATQTVGKRILARRRKDGDEWFSLMTALKLIMALCLVYALYAHHQSKLDWFVSVELEA